MSRTARLLLVGAAAFAAFAAAALPARVAFDLAARPAGIEAALVHGTVWDAAAWRIRAGDLAIAEAQARLRPASLLSGAARFDARIVDPVVQASGAVRMGLGSVALETVSGVILLSAIPALNRAGLPGAEPVRFDIERLALARDGACLTAEGRATTAALVSFGERFGVSLPLIEARLACLGGRPGVEFSGSNETLTLAGRVRAVDGDVAWRADARTGNEDVAAALAALGFVESGGAWRAGRGDIGEE